MNNSSVSLLKSIAKTTVLLLFCGVTANAQDVDMRIQILSHTGKAISTIEFLGTRVPLASAPVAPYRVKVSARDARSARDADGVHEVTTKITELWDGKPELFGDELPPNNGTIRISYPSHVLQMLEPGGRQLTPNPEWEIIDGDSTFSSDFRLALSRPRSQRDDWKKVYSLDFKPDSTRVGAGIMPETGAVVGATTSATVFADNVNDASIDASNIEWDLGQTSGPADTVLTVTAMGGDTDLDGDVDFKDFLVVQTNFGMAGTWNDGDFDGDGLVSFADFLLLSSNFGLGT